jgi:hypothetical protein
MKIQSTKNSLACGAFTLLEVMFAVAAFFAASFAILALVSTSLRSAHMLQQPMVDSGELAGWLSQTNSLVEGEESGGLSELLGKQYQDYNWKYDIQEVQTNKLFQVDFIVQRDSGDKPVVAKMSILLFRPASPAGSLDGATTK